MYYSSLDFYVKAFEDKPREYAFSAQSREECVLWQSTLRNRLCEISGVNRGVRCEGRHEFLRTDDINGLSGEYHLLETEPDVWMPFYLFRPGEGGEHPILIIPHGHGGGKREAVIGQEQFIRESLEDGFLVVCPDTRGSGDRREFPEQKEEPQAMRSNSHRELLQVCIGFGRSVIGTAVWDLMRLADYLKSLPETGDFMACAGMSGGGQQTLWWAALDERVNAAITSGYFYGMKESLIELPQNCACNFVPFLFETADMGDIGALIAPRPFFIESGKQDHLSGKSGLQNVYPQVETTRKAYRLLDSEECLIHSIHPEGHKWIGRGMREFLMSSRKRYTQMNERS